MVTLILKRVATQVATQWGLVELGTTSSTLVGPASIGLCHSPVFTCARDNFTCKMGGAWCLYLYLHCYYDIVMDLLKFIRFIKLC